MRVLVIQSQQGVGEAAAKERAGERRPAGFCRLQGVSLARREDPGLELRRAPRGWARQFGPATQRLRRRGTAGLANGASDLHQPSFWQFHGRCISRLSDTYLPQKPQEWPSEYRFSGTCQHGQIQNSLRRAAIAKGNPRTITSFPTASIQRPGHHRDCRGAPGQTRAVSGLDSLGSVFRAPARTSTNRAKLAHDRSQPPAKSPRSVPESSTNLPRRKTEPTLARQLGRASVP